MRTIQGQGVSAGIAAGPLYFLRQERRAVDRRCAADPTAELRRFAAAQAEAIEALGQLAEQARTAVGEEAALLFETHQMMAEDLDYIEAIQGRIGDGLGAEAAVSDTAEQFAQMFAATDDSYMQARAADVRDVSRRILDILQGTAECGIDSDRPVILVSEDLSPSETVQLDKSKLLGFVTAGGSASGHTAILARTMGIPAVIGVGDALTPELEGREAVLDGETGQVVLEPEPETRAALLQKQAAQAAQRARLEALRGQEDITLDGQRVCVYCNIGSPADIPAVQANDGGGIGLFRSEFLYLACADYPTEEQLFSAYRDAVEAMAGKLVIIRTLDIGADKQVGYFGLPQEDNPAMGMRAIRICLTRPEVFRTQLRALYRASAYGRLGIMFPMVTSLWELLECKKACREVQAELEREGVPFSADVPLGVMIETPAAVWVSDQLAQEADFFSIGTNDLTQYTLACDRQNSNLGRFYDPHHPAVLRAIQMTVDSAHKHGKWAGICGELAADLALTPLFLAMGVDELSVAPEQVLPLRGAIRAVDVAASRERLLTELQ